MKVVVLADVLAATAKLAGVSQTVLCAPGRDPEVVAWRQAGMAAARQATGASYPAIGQVFRRDHTTVLHGCERAQRLHPERVARILDEAHAAARRRSTTMTATYWGPAQIRAVAAFLSAFADAMEGPPSAPARNGT